MRAEKELFNRIEEKLQAKLELDNFKKTESKDEVLSFGSRFTVWKNMTEQLAIRLTWDGKESWFIVEESPFNEGAEPISWADLVIVPYDKQLESKDYNERTLKDIVDEIK
ncbi:hypothetical protein LVD15_17575 [Fulvivirga maritima]|uniref:hypothetical protein n=1 Tax=Fulvivirga maritima TaxID=2904247 RepID=UPI001F3668AB|nr:hypothetical protein [Fulvivirga maritima]UII25109.1 hypothetical protein LVD15_17575 [Fulvivirga maritima]